MVRRASYYIAFPKRFTRSSRSKVEATLCSVFGGFTWHATVGGWRDIRERSAVIEAFTGLSDGDLEAVAEGLRVALKQTEVWLWIEAGKLHIARTPAANKPIRTRRRR